MFFEVELTEKINIAARFFRDNIKETVGKRLITKVEGKVKGRYGYIVLVKNIVNIEKGKISESFGHATYKIKFKAIVFRAFKGEVLDCRVTSVNKLGFYASCGVLQVFVSKRRIPSELEFNPTIANEPIYISKKDHDLRITKDEDVRLRIMGVKKEQSNLFAIGSIDANYLGPL